MCQFTKMTETTYFDSNGNPTRTVITKSNDDPPFSRLNAVTIGVGMGWSYLGKAPFDYFLTPDSFLLQKQPLAHSGVVLSSVITIKLGKDLASEGGKLKAVHTTRNGNVVTRQTENVKWWEPIAINLSLNLAEISNGDIAFNKTIDGGIGIGYYIKQSLQVAVFYDMIRVRQMRDYYINTFEGKAIPSNNNGEVYNALDQTNNNLFYNKYYSGFSIKAVLSFGNKKED